MLCTFEPLEHVMVGILQSEMALRKMKKQLAQKRSSGAILAIK